MQIFQNVFSRDSLCIINEWNNIINQINLDIHFLCEIFKYTYYEIHILSFTFIDVFNFQSPPIMIYN